jgi:predicted phosphodiesterase
MNSDILLDLTKGSFPIIIKPNLGQPVFLNIHNRSETSASTHRFKSYVMAMSFYSVEIILESFISNIYIKPILKDEGDFEKRRGEKYPIKPIEISKVEKLDFEKHAMLREENCIAHDFYKVLLGIDEIFGKRTALYEIIFEISVPVINAIAHLLNQSNRDFIIFDIIHEIPNTNSRKVNFHSIAVYDKDWTDFKFIQATDLHTARRNDFIINFLRNKVRSKMEKFEGKKKKFRKIDQFVLNRDYEFKKGFQEDRLDDLKFAKFNFNYNLRKLVDFTNSKVSSKECDFVLITGDLIDYFSIGKGNNVYKNNLEVFLEVILGINKGLDKWPFFESDQEFFNKKEILAPIITTLGNHDYHKGLYGLRLAGINKIFGMTYSELRGYRDIKMRNYIYSFYSRNKFIADYLRYVNPNCNFMMEIGDEYNFIFLDTGADSLADFHDLMKGGASTKGIKDYQIDILRTYIKLSLDKKIFIVMHTPPVSPNLSHSKMKKYKKLLNIRKRKLEWPDFYEENLRKHDLSPRVEQLLNMKYQTIMYNWKTFMRIITGSDKIIQRKVDLVLCGHTHSIKEYRLRETDEGQMINYGFWALPFYIEIPCEMYSSMYREKLKEFQNEQDRRIWFDVNKPFILQTQALGPLSAKFDTKSPGFRYITIKNNEIESMDIYSLHLI